MRNILLASTAAVCLVLTIPAANAQSDVKKHDEMKKEQVKQPSAAEHRQQAQEHQPSRSTTGQASEEKKDAGKHESRTLPDRLWCSGYWSHFRCRISAEVETRGGSLGG